MAKTKQQQTREEIPISNQSSVGLLCSVGIALGASYVHESICIGFWIRGHEIFQ